MITGLFVLMLGIHSKLFYLSIAATTIIGMGESIGTITNLGFIKGFEADVVLGYSSGTGFAGLFGSIYYLVMNAWKVDFRIIWGFQICLLCIYYFAFQ